MTTEQKLATVPERAITLPMDPEVANKLFEQNFGKTLSPSFERVKIPTGGGTQFAIPGIEQEEMAPTIEGVVLIHHGARGYWPNPFSGGEPPVCSSLDGMHGTGEPGGSCFDCPYGQWGSDPGGGRGKACKEMHRIYILRSGEMLPLLLTLPPTSIQPLADYATRLQRLRLGMMGVVTRVSLTKDKNVEGIEFSKAVFAGVGRLPDAQAQKMEELAMALGPYVGIVPIEAIGDEIGQYGTEEPGEETGAPPEEPAVAPPVQATIPSQSTIPDDMLSGPVVETGEW